MIFPDQRHSASSFPYTGSAGCYRIWLIAASAVDIRVLARPIRTQQPLVELYSVCAVPDEKNIIHFAEFLEPLAKWLQLSLRHSMFDRLILAAESEVCRQIYHGLPPDLSRCIMAEMEMSLRGGPDMDSRLQDILSF